VLLRVNMYCLEHQVRSDLLRDKLEAAIRTQRRLVVRRNALGQLRIALLP